MPEVNVNGQTISYTERGRGLPLVLVHGFPLDNRIWEEQISALSDKSRVIAPDLPGFGKSKSTRPFTFESLADDLHAFLSQIKALPCALAGLSMGGYMSFAYDCKYPTDLKALILVDTKAEADTPEGKAGRNKMIETARSSGSPAIAAAMMPKMITSDSQQKRPRLVQQVKAIMEFCPPLTIEHALAAMRDRTDYRDCLPSIAVPTLIIVGDADAITPPAVAESMHKEIPHSKLVIIKGAGHLSPMEQPEQVNQAMRQFLSTIN
ncbi:MAG TPA: alpha/beta hydrolase [Tepidisphaeraceae bacterium]|nr:alpha/beta hydrolase [Tepidisphaeraceae bacterium]